jgi:hypothetical protein
VYMFIRTHETTFSLVSLQAYYLLPVLSAKVDVLKEVKTVSFGY